MPLDKSAIGDVTDTAAWVATYRARETLRPDALFKDPLAALLAGSHGEAIANQMPSSGADWYVVIRTCIIDAFILASIKEGVDTVINLGAGLDTRPYRLDLPRELLWIEVDFPKIVEQKTQTLHNQTANCRLERFALDLSRHMERQKFFAAINARSKKVLVLTEGLLPYLTEDQVLSLGKDLTLNSNFHLWIVDYFSPQFMYVMRRGKQKKQLQNAPFLFNPANWEAFFSNANWNLKDMQFIAPTARRLGREPPFPGPLKLFFKLLPGPLMRRLDEMSGFALLEVKR